MSAVPIADPDVKRDRIILEGAIPARLNRPKGCPFANALPPARSAPSATTRPRRSTATESGHRIALATSRSTELKSVERISF